jgi:FAD/FMN-containing dehydrogenase
MTDTAMELRKHAPRKVFDGFGRAVLASSRYVTPESGDEMASVLRDARKEGLPVTFRGSGRSYGDASLTSHGLTVDGTRMNRMLAWDPVTGIADVQGGVTIEGLWRRTITDGYWPHVVPGTMFPTMAGALSMNIHGKNNFKEGPFGEHVVDFDLVTPQGELLRCSRTENADVFHTAISGLGLLGAITRARVQLKKVESGLLRVDPCAVSSLREMFEQFEQRLPHSDYLVGWVDCLSEGSELGRGEIHQANYLHGDEDPLGDVGFHTERQTLPTRILGFPKDKLWHFMRPWFNNLGVRCINTAKMVSARMNHGKPYLQSHVGFAFLLDYVPNWRLAYGDGGFIQYQVFIPKENALGAMEDILRMAQEAKLPSYLGVLKKHRPDDFCLSHAVDGYSMAMDYRVTKENRERLWALTHRFTERVLEAKGRFYFAKDAVLTQEQVKAAYGEERLARFRAMKERLDPEQVLVSDLGRRVLGLSTSTSAVS